jgi:hypothetical protein
MRRTFRWGAMKPLPSGITARFWIQSSTLLAKLNVVGRAGGRVLRVERLRWLGYWLVADGICWVVLAVTGFLAPRYNDVLFRAFQPAFLAELGIMLWLLIVGAKESALTVRASAGGPE